MAAIVATELTSQLIQGMSASYERSKRLDRTFNYEKVFWNSAFSLGIIASVWLGVKAGQAIKALQDPVGTAEKAVTTWIEDSKEAGLETVASFVEGENKAKSLAGVPSGLAGPISFYRNNPEEWKALKEAQAKSESVTGEAEQPKDALDYIDGVYADYGEYLPAGAVLLQLALEANRVRLARMEYDQLEREMKA